MDSGGTRTLLPPGKQAAAVIGQRGKYGSDVDGATELQHVSLLGCYMIKPHGQLVRVSFTHCCASTPRLSTL